MKHTKSRSFWSGFFMCYFFGYWYWYLWEVFFVRIFKAYYIYYVSGNDRGAATAPAEIVQT